MLEFYNTAMFFIIVPIGIAVLYFFGYFFRSAILGHDLDKGNGFLQFIFTLIIGIIVFWFAGFIFGSMRF